MKHSLLIACLFSIAITLSGQNLFPLISSGSSFGGSGDFTNISDPQLKLQSTTSYIRVAHLSTTSISTVYNYEANKNVYWGEDTDGGQYSFRGRDVHIGRSLLVNMNANFNGNLTLGTDGGLSMISGPSYSGAIQIKTHGGLSGSANRYLRLGIKDNNSVFYPVISINDDQKVGIGTTIPSVQLEVVGGGVSNGLNVRNPGEVAGWGLAIRQKDDLSGHIVCSGRNLQIEPGWTNSLILGSTQMESNGGKTIFPGGYVGIGTSNPTQRLTVKGTVYSTEVKVDLAAGTGPDYVFEPTYTLPSLYSVQSYINQNKHLPEVPSAKEMEANGVNLGEMNMLLLKKVEELTLYLIDQDKKNNELTQQVKLLWQQMEEIKK